MPVTAKLSRAFYERFGDKITNELVNWFNAVDETYRNDLRELNELNFARFDAKVGERLAELDAKWTRRLTEFDATWTARWTALDAKIEQRTAALEAKFERRLRKTEMRLAGLTIAWVPAALAIFEFVFRR